MMPSRAGCSRCPASEDSSFHNSDRLRISSVPPALRGPSGMNRSTKWASSCRSLPPSAHRRSRASSAHCRATPASSNSIIPGVRRTITGRLLSAYRNAPRSLWKPASVAWSQPKTLRPTRGLPSSSAGSKRLLVCVQAVFKPPDLVEHCFPLALPGSIGRSVCQDRFDLFPHRLDDRPPVLSDIGDHDQPLAQTLAIESLADHIERGLLLADNQDALLSADPVRDHVDDGLALPRPRRSLDDETRTASRHHHGRVLRVLYLLCRVRHSEERFEIGSGRRDGFHLPDILDNRLADKRYVKQHRRRCQLDGARRHTHVGTGKPRQ